MQHRFAYVGPDLQDVYGIDPATIGRAAPLLDSFTPGSTIRRRWRRWPHPDGVLLSAETLHDYQLHPGDLVRLRLQTGPDQRYRPVDFHVVGLVTEFPTAPKDSFIVANARYLAARTGSAAVSTYLVSSSDPARTARRAARAAGRHRRAGAGRRVGPLDGDHRVRARGRRPRRPVPAGAGVRAGAGAGLLGAGSAARCRAAPARLVLLAALGATARQRGRFLAGEAWALLIGGVLAGAAITPSMSYLLVKVLTGIFDPPPTAASIPGGYLLVLVAGVAAATGLAVAALGRLGSRAGPAELRAAVREAPWPTRPPGLPSGGVQGRCAILEP